MESSGTADPHLRPAIGVDGAGAPKAVIARLEHLSKFAAVRQLDNHDQQSPLARGLFVEFAGYQAGFVPGDRPVPRRFEPPGGLPTVTTGEWIFLRIRNSSERSLNVTAFDLQTDWSITQIFPARDGAWFVELESGSEQLLNLQASLPAGYAEASTG